MSSSGVMNNLSHLNFDNRFVSELPADVEQTHRLRQVRNACFSFMRPTPVKAPRLMAHAQEVADLLDITSEQCQLDEFAQVFAGNQMIDGMQPYAVCYGGHQFGNWAGQLGDGRAIALGEVLNTKGEHWEIQLKGAGPTPIPAVPMAARCCALPSVDFFVL